MLAFLRLSQIEATTSALQRRVCNTEALLDLSQAGEELRYTLGGGDADSRGKCQPAKATYEPPVSAHPRLGKEQSY